MLRIALPSLAAMLSTGLCTLLDGLLLARCAPEISAAAGICFPIVTTQQAVGFTLGMGAGSHVSRSLGSGDKQSARQVAAAALLLAALLGLALLGAGLMFLSPLLALLSAGADTLPHASRYAVLLLLASPFSCAGLVFSSLLRGQGKTACNMAAYAASGAVGAGLDFLLIARMGIRGAGLSLLVREALSCLLLAAFYLRAKGVLRPAMRDFLPRAFVLPAIMRSGLPTLLRQGAISLSGAMLSRAASGFGAAALSGMGLAVRALSLIASAAIGFGQGFSPVCGAAHGAGDTIRVKAAYRFCMKLLVLALTGAGVLTFLLADRLLALFEAETHVAAFAARVLRAQSAVLPMQGAVILMNMLTQSKGQTVRATLVATSRQGIFLIPLLLAMPRFLGETGLILCQSVADALALLFSLTVVHGGGFIDRFTRSHYNRTMESSNHPGRYAYEERFPERTPRAQKTRRESSPG